MAEVSAYGNHIVYKGTIFIDHKSFYINNKGDILCKVATPLPKEKKTTPLLEYKTVPIYDIPNNDDDNNNPSSKNGEQRDYSMKKARLPLPPILMPLLFIKPYKDLYKNIKYLINKIK